MSPELPRPAQGRRVSVLVLVVGMLATAFGVWREGELARRGAVIRWQDSFAQFQPALQPLFSQKFQALRDLGKSTLRRENFSEASWQDFLTGSEWQSRFPGMLEIGYARFQSAHSPVRFLASEQASPAHAPGFDLASDPVIRAAVEKCADAGYGVASLEIPLAGGSNNVTQVIIGLLPLPMADRRPGLAAENHANLHGFVFFALDQQTYFAAVKDQLKAFPFELRLLASGETAPPRTATVRPFSIS